MAALSAKQKKGISLVIAILAVGFMLSMIVYHNVKGISGYINYLGPENENCIEKRAVILDRSRGGGSKNSGGSMDYAYKINGKRYRESIHLDEHSYLAYHGVDSVEICVHKDNSERHNLISEMTSTMYFGGVILLDLILVIGGFLAYRILPGRYSS